MNSTTQETKHTGREAGNQTTTETQLEVEKRTSDGFDDLGHFLLQAPQINIFASW